MSHVTKWPTPANRQSEATDAVLSAQCPVPSAQCSVLSAQCSVPSAQCPHTYVRFRLDPPILTDKCMVSYYCMCDVS